ncbi:siderophore-interacting protein [Streptomyces sp. NPDC059740]|uniref:siderophore-interacting protein n=1 Tax=Streptomyces sp. NPDC059740 TaxID=3346926 RepID=UPI0036683925
MTTTAAPTTPFRFFDVQVLRSHRLGPSMVRVTFGGGRLASVACGGRDQRIKLFLPQAHQSAPVFDDTGEGWYTAWRAQDPAERAVMRSYTVSGQRTTEAGTELDIDFALHGDGGPACRWASRCRPGDQVALLAPVVEDNGGIDFRPPPGTDWILLAGDETALPAMEAILAWLPPGTRAKVWVEVPSAQDRRPLPSFADTDITWLVREGAARDRAEAMVDAVRGASLPEGAPYAWIAGEAGTVKALRRHLVGERGLDRRSVKFTGYWRRGACEEDLIAELTAAAATEQ